MIREDELRRVAATKTFDLRPCQGATLSDLSVDVFMLSYRSLAVAPEVIEQNNRPVEHQLASLRFFDNRTLSPTHAGLLVFGKNIRRWIPGAYVQFVRFEGTSLADEPVDDKVLVGDLLTVLRDLDSLLKLQLERKPVPVSMLREDMVYSYPAEAVREFALNAIMHRSYESTAPVRFYWFDDHIEIQNPGGLYGEATRDNFPRQRAYRNPIVAEAMKVLGYVNTYGRGVLRAQQALADNGNPPAEYSFGDTYMLVTIRRPA